MKIKGENFNTVQSIKYDVGLVLYHMVKHSTLQNIAKAFCACLYAMDVNLTLMLKRQGLRASISLGPLLRSYSTRYRALELMK